MGARLKYEANSSPKFTMGKGVNHMAQPIIVEEYRGGNLENTHQGMICIVNDKKEVIYEKGDINQKVFYRSAMKPIQAIPVFTTDVIEKYNITDKEAALFTASQRGEQYHQDGLESLLKKLDLQESMLICGASYPLNEEPKRQYNWDHKPKRKLLHNCAGKHLGMLAYVREKGLDVEHYADPNYPLQQDVLKYVSELSETPLDEINHGVDGCGLPIYGVPLKNMAISYLKFAAPDLLDDDTTKQAVVSIGEVMNKHPEIVASHHFICTALLEDQNIVAKGGAQGVYCLSLKKERISIALKVLSGSELVWPILVAEILEKINYSNKDTIARLREIRSDVILNDDGDPIGATKVIL